MSAKKFNILFYTFIAFLLLFSTTTTLNAQAAQKVMWGKTELKLGQIGKVTILDDTPLVRIANNGSLSTIRTLKKGDEYRVYNFKGQEGGLYGIGGESFVQKSKLVQYETPSKAKLNALIGFETKKTSKLSTLKVMERWQPLPDTIKAHRNDRDAPPGSIRYLDYKGGRYFSFEHDNKVRIFDMEKNEVSKVLGNDLHMSIGGNIVVWSSDSRKTITLYDLTTKKQKKVDAPDNGFIYRLSVKPDGKFIAISIYYEDRSPKKKRKYLYDVEKNKMIPLYEDSQIDSLNPWSGDELIYQGISDFEEETNKIGIKIIIDGKMVDTSKNKVVRFFAYNVKTGKHRILENMKSPINFQVAGDWIVYESDGVYLYNMKTGETKTVIKRAFTGESQIANVFFPTTNGESVVYTRIGQYMKYDIATGKTTQLFNLPDPPVHESDYEFSVRKSLLVEDLLFLYGNNIETTIVKF
ncbi:hypothetical protein [Bacillus sp. FJAT-22090]|uniref:hypothetical protein n=1 Tax=Bacillus sp. FJAT-22090 TaxID=1581038 RepID=UPI0011A2231B|nr:hypothetical protein [Bacillus sp. FJAT-22090]